MSNKAIAWAFKIAMPPHGKLLLLSLADRADDAGRCFPSIGDCAARTGLSRDRVVHLIRCLEVAGVIAVARGGPRQVSRYILRVGATFQVPLRFPRSNRCGTYGRTVILNEPSYKPNSATNVAAGTLRAPAHASDSGTSFGTVEGCSQERLRKSVRTQSGTAPASQKPPNPPPGGEPGSDAAAWPTAQMIGFARSLGVDPAAVLDAIAAGHGLPEPGDDPAPWRRRWFAMCHGTAGDFADRVQAGATELEELLAADGEKCAA